MKCPYNGFKDCIVEKCPSCNYESKEYKYLYQPPGFSEVHAYYKTETEYKFVSCKLVEKGVQPVPVNEHVIKNNNTTKTTVVVNKKLF